MLKRLSILAVVLMIVMAISFATYADDFDHDVDIDVAWQVLPAFYVSVGYDQNNVEWWDQDDGRLFKNGNGWGWMMNLGADAPEELNHTNLTWINAQHIMATVASNDDWKIVFTKPHLSNSNTNDNAAKPIRAITKYAKHVSSTVPTPTNVIKNTTAESFIINKSIGVHEFDWTLEVPWEEWETYNGTYTSHLNIQFYQL